MHIPYLSSTSPQGKRIILRADYDVRVRDGKVVDPSRIMNSFETIKWLLSNGALKITIIAHRDRPQGYDQNYSLLEVCDYLNENLGKDVAFLKHKPITQFFETYDEFSRTDKRVVLLDNIRFYKEEEENASTLAEELSYFGEMYVNDAFASSHRTHTSVYALPKLMNEKYPGTNCFGVHFEKEIVNLTKLRENAKRPVVFIVSGAKEDKLAFLDSFKEIADWVLIGGRLPEFMPEEQGDPKVFVAKLNPDREDITIHSIEQFELKIMSAGTIFVSGPVGKFEDQGQRLGTQRVFTAISKSSAYKVAGGGDTTTAINTLKLEKSFDWISSGGGASLEYISQGKLPGIDALLSVK